MVLLASDLTRSLPRAALPSALALCPHIQTFSFSLTLCRVQGAIVSEPLGAATLPQLFARGIVASDLTRSSPRAALPVALFLDHTVRSVSSLTLHQVWG